MANNSFFRLPTTRGLACSLLLAIFCAVFLTGYARADDPPTISSFSPASGPVGSTVVIEGTNFVPPLAITFGGNVQAAGSFSTTQITVTVPDGAQSGEIKVSTADGSASTATSFIVGSATPVVTLAATVPAVTTGSGQVGEFTLSLSSAQANDVIVDYTLGGTAVNGTDYALLPGTAKIKAGKTSKVIKITPQGDLGGAAKKTVKLTLAAGSGYTVGTTTFEKVKIVAGQ